MIQAATILSGMAAGGLLTAVIFPNNVYIVIFFMLFSGLVAGYFSFKK